MSCFKLCLRGIVSCVLISTTLAHLCLISPRQRGPMDISEGGSHTCFRHGAPCGGQAPEVPATIHLQGGRPVFIKWQQNYNHYTVGYPGYMDISIAVANEVAQMNHVTGSPDPFRVLAVVADKDEYDQAHQRNYTAVVTLPNMACDHCVIRARYVSHKPGETIFYQCADVAISTSSPASPQRVSGMMQTQQREASSIYPYLMPGPIVQSETFNQTHSTLNTKPTLISVLSNGNKNINDNGEISQILEEKEALNKDAKNKSTITDSCSMAEDHIKRAVDFSNSNYQTVLKQTTFTSDPSITSKTRSYTKGFSATQNADALLESPKFIPLDKEQEKTSPNGWSFDSSPEAFLEQNDLQISSTSEVIYGLSNNIDFPGNADLVTFDTMTGIRYQVTPLAFRVDSPLFSHTGLASKSKPLNSSLDFVTDGVLALDGARNVAVMPMNRHNNMEAIAGTVIEMNTQGGQVQAVYNVSNAPTSPPRSAFSAVKVEIESSFITFNIEPDEKEVGKFNFIVGRLYAGGAWVMLSKTDQGEDTYINFMWAEYDISVKTLYVLLGNENDALGMTARLYKFFVIPGPPPIQPIPDFHSYVTLDVSTYTFQAFHLHPYHTNLLYAVSPGLHNATTPSYHLVVVDVDSGTVKEEMQITPPGIFERYYGGAIINGLRSYPPQLLHVLRIAHTEADVIGTLDLAKKTASFSQVTNLRNVYSLYANF